MKRFNKTISVEISVDSIAQQLLSNLHPEFKHREQLAESIIGTALNSNSMLYIYNSLNGFTNNINFEVGDTVFCEKKIYMHELDTDTKWKEVYKPMGLAEVTEINLYSETKLKVKYTTINRDGEAVTGVMWVKHDTCDKAAVEPEMTDIDEVQLASQAIEAVISKF